LIVDFGNTPPLVDVLPSTPAIRIVRTNTNTELFHKARALNIGIKAVETKYLCVTDADQLFAPNFFGVVIDQLNQDPKCIVFCKTHFLPFMPALVTPENSVSRYPHLLLLARRKGVKPRGRGCCHGAPTEWFMKVQGYDEAYVGWGAEDRDLEVRAGFDGLRFRWIEHKTSMVHLPHPKEGKYYNPKYFEENMKLYEYRRDLKDKHEKISNIIVNRSVEWGKL
jgi:hypothetical protein